MAEAAWRCPNCGSVSTDDDELDDPVCTKCKASFAWEDVEVLEIEEEDPTCEYCGAEIDPDNGPLCRICYEEDERWQYADICYDRQRGT